MSISSNLNKLTTDITNAYTSIENKLPKILPEGYTQVEYIESTGTQYIDTGYKINNNCSAKYKYEYISGNALSGVYNGYQDLYFGIVRPSTGKLSYRYSGEFYEGNIPSTNTIYNVEVSLKKNNQYLKVNNIIEQESQSNDNFTNNLNCYIFNINNLNFVEKISAKLYYFKIYDNDVLVRHFIPCYRNSDNEIGLYDTVNNVFYTNQGTGTFLKGKNNSIGMDKNTDNLHTAIDSIEIIEQQSAEGESLSLANTKAMPYSDYVVKGKSEQEGEPSPSIPSDIHSVADDVNLFDDTTVNNKWISVQGNIIDNSGASSIKYNCASNETYSLSAYWNNENNSNIIAIAFYNSSDTLLDRQVLINSGTITATAPANSSYMYAGHFTIKPTTIKLQKGSTATPYSPYNQGTVTIKQRGKNLLKNILESQTINGITITKYSDGTFLANGTANNLIAIALCDISNIKAIINLNKEITLTGCPIGGGNNTFSLRWLEQGGTTQEDFGSGATFTPSNYSTNLYLIIRNGVQLNNALFKPMIRLSTIIDNTYEPYQTPHDYTFQTEPLRSLPNGVKDTIEVDGIHRRERKTILDENNISIVSSFGYRDEMPRVYIEKNKLGFKSGWEENICLMNKYKTINKTSLVATGTFSTNFTRGYIEIFNENFTDLQTAKEILLGTEIICQLSEEIIEPLTQNQATTMLDIIKTGSYEGTTNIYTDEDVKPTMKVDYYKKA